MIGNISVAHFIRHGESLANAGGATCESGGLTELGIRQAVDFAKKINASPDIIVVSQYSRTQQTAEPTIRKFPLVPVEVWPVQEFQYIDLKRVSGLSQAERRPIQMAYFARDDSDYVDGGDAESYNQFMTRIKGIIFRLRKYPNALVFTHDLFMRGILFVIGNIGSSPKILLKSREIANLEILTIKQNTAVETR
jgi:broad specificity phosphatase PhoE